LHLSNGREITTGPHPHRTSSTTTTATTYANLHNYQHHHHVLPLHHHHHHYHHMTTATNVHKVTRITARNLLSFCLCRHHHHHYHHMTTATNVHKVTHITARNLLSFCLCRPRIVLQRKAPSAHRAPIATTASCAASAKHHQTAIPTRLHAI
jgi:hypothetical protein